MDGLFFPTIPGRPDVFVVTDQFDRPSDVPPEDQTREIIPYLVDTCDCSGVSLTDAQGVTRALYNTCTLPREGAQWDAQYPDIGAWRQTVMDHPDLLMDLVPPGGACTIHMVDSSHGWTAVCQRDGEGAWRDVEAYVGEAYAAYFPVHVAAPPPSP